MFFRITKYGSFFTTLDNYKWLRELEIDDETIIHSKQVTYALNYSFQKGMYKVDNYEELFFYDTFRKKDPITETPNINVQALKSASLPSEWEWKDIGDDRTIAGKIWDNIWGFTKSERSNFDSSHRVDVKFYAVRYPFYSEMGIKTKTHKKGWTGLWRKQNCDEIINGWEMLNIKEKWSGNYFGPYFDPNNNMLPDFIFQTQTAKDLAYNQSVFLEKIWKTYNIMGLNLDFSQKDKVGALWNACKSFGKTTVHFLNNKLNNQIKLKKQYV